MGRGRAWLAAAVLLAAAATHGGTYRLLPLPAVERLEPAEARAAGGRRLQIPGLGSDGPSLDPVQMLLACVAMPSLGGNGSLNDSLGGLGALAGNVVETVVRFDFVSPNATNGSMPTALLGMDRKAKDEAVLQNYTFEYNVNEYTTTLLGTNLSALTNGSNATAAACIDPADLALCAEKARGMLGLLNGSLGNPYGDANITMPPLGDLKNISADDLGQALMDNLDFNFSLEDRGNYTEQNLSSYVDEGGAGITHYPALSYILREPLWMVVDGSRE
jgi:hypothetical protein